MAAGGTLAPGPVPEHAPREAAALWADGDGPGAVPVTPPAGPAGDEPVSAAEVEGLLREVALVMRQRGRQYLPLFELTPPQFDALVEVVYTGDLTMGELCERLSLASSTVTDLVGRMERSGFVQRTRDPDDRRVVRLQVTDRGRAVFDGVVRTRAAYLEGVLGQMSREEQHLVADAIQLLYERMTRPGRVWGG